MAAIRAPTVARADAEVPLLNRNSLAI